MNEKELSIYNRPAISTITIPKDEYEKLLKNQKKVGVIQHAFKRFESIEGEIWEEIPGACSYEVSNLGRLRKCYRDRYNTYFVSVVPVRVNKDGYMRKRLNLGDGLTKEIYLHKVVAEAFVPRAESMRNWIPYHINGDNADGRASNLGWRPKKIPERQTGRLKVIEFISKVNGEIKQRRAKLSIGDIEEIGRLLKLKKLTQRQIAHRFNVSQTLISRIKKQGIRFVNGKAIPYQRFL